jgi:hypothetical protein
MSGQVISSVLSAVAVVILAMIGSTLRRMSNDIRRFMREHLWLLAMADWTKTSVQAIMHHLNINGTSPPNK